MARSKKTARLSCVWKFPSAQRRRVEQASPVREEEHSLPPLDLAAGSANSYSGWSSDDDDSERNLEDDEDAATATPEDDSPQLEWWEKAQR